jgi:hypothetical protein
MVFGFERRIATDAEGHYSIGISVLAKDADDYRATAGEHSNDGARTGRHPFSRLSLQERVYGRRSAPRGLIKAAIDYDRPRQIARAKVGRFWFLGRGAGRPDHQAQHDS